MTIVHAIGEIRPGTGTGFLWIPACPADKGTCTRDESAVTCRDCLAKARVEALALNLVPLADQWAEARDAGDHSYAEALVDAVGMMTGLAYDEVFEILDEVMHRKHGDTVKYVHAPF